MKISEWFLDKIELVWCDVLDIIEDHWKDFLVLNGIIVLVIFWMFILIVFLRSAGMT